MVSKTYYINGQKALVFVWELKMKKCHNTILYYSSFSDKLWMNLFMSLFHKQIQILLWMC